MFIIMTTTMLMTMVASKPEPVSSSTKVIGLCLLVSSAMLRMRSQVQATWPTFPSAPPSNTVARRIEFLDAKKNF